MRLYINIGAQAQPEPDGARSGWRGDMLPCFLPGGSRCMKSTELSHDSRFLPVRAGLRARPGLAGPYLPPRHSMIWVIGAIGLALYCA